MENLVDQLVKGRKYKSYLNRTFYILIYIYRMFNKSIVIVNDDHDLLNMYSEALKMSDYDVSSFADPVLAYEHIKENPHKYSLVITNDKKHDMNGLLVLNSWK